ncbi:MAG TPA: aminotransferase class I/II-fold pyridoxal phosphate-dependent enzyme, partial [Beutenbergiaceae bacterium]|nr:aminotransferase class I/II-fold pyridoxal phosphate-dependent enzyme [Beutenbergiaceae bacterium]
LLSTLGVEVVELDTGPDTGFQPTVDALAAIHGHKPIRGFVLASPANPTGTMISQNRLTQIAAWCQEQGVRIISDEIYHGITYTQADHPRGVCVAGLDEHAVVVSSFSKYWGMTGWRIGWMIMPPELRAPIDALAGNVALSPPSPAQAAVLAAFSEQAYAEADARVESFAQVRRIALDAAPRLGWGPLAPADGAFYLYAGVPLGEYGSSSQWANALLEQAGVAVVPGTDFDAVNGGGYVRLSFAAGQAAVEEAFTRIEQFISR